MNPQMGEATIDQNTQQRMASDVVNPQGQQKMSSALASTMMKKGLLDFILKGISEKVGGEFTSRVKNPETMVQKIVKKRMDGEKYGMEDVNDVYGGRIIVNREDIPQVQKMLNKASELGVFDIKKQEMVKNEAHQAYHVDILTSDGVKGEIQVMTPQDELKSVAEHPLYSAIGDKLPKPAKELVDKQGKVIDTLNKDTAHSKAMAIQELGKQNNGLVDPRVIAGIIKSK